MVEPFKLYDTDLNDDHISWSSNYNAIEVKPDDIPQLMTLVFHDNIADKAFNNSDTHVAPGVPSNHIGNMKIEHDYRTAVKALYQGHSVQIFNWDINIDRVHEVFQDSERERFVITMPDGMPGIIASEIYELLKSHNIGLRYHL